MARGTQRRRSDHPLARDLRRLRSQRGRTEAGQFYVEGSRFVARALAEGATIEQVILAPDLVSDDDINAVVNPLVAAGVSLVEVSAEAFQSIFFKGNLDGIGAVVRQNIQPLDTAVGDGSLGWVALDRIGNPGNLGAIMRTCDAVGCAGLLMLGHTTDPYHPAAIKASMGTVFSMQLIRTDFDELLAWKTASQMQVTGTSDAATVEYRAVEYRQPAVLLMGSERDGLTDQQQLLCDQVVRIPMVGRADSLNLAVAASVVLYEIFFQHRTKSPG